MFVKEGEMELSRHHPGGKRAGLTGAVVATALCVALVAAAPASAGKLTEYGAELPTPLDTASFINFKVKEKKNKRTKRFRPVAIKKLDVTYMYLYCSDQSPTRVSFTWGLLKAAVPSLQDEIPVSGRRFSLSVTGGEPTDGFTLTFRGRVPRNGPPTGTIRYTSTGPKLVPNPADPGGPYIEGQVSCDSGSLSWTGQSLEGIY